MTKLLFHLCLSLDTIHAKDYRMNQPRDTYNTEEGLYNNNHVERIRQ